MKFREYIVSVDIGVILFYLANAIGLLGIILIVPIAVSLLTREYIYSWIFGSLSLVTVLVGLVGRKFGDKNMKLELTEALIVTALSYLVFSLICAIPFLPIKPFIDGFFEAMSGFTTTGLTMISESTTPLSLLFFRAYSQWLGGMGIIVLSLAVLIRPGKTAFKLYDTEFGEENIIGSVVSTAKVIIRIYLVLTLFGFLAFLLAGMSLFDGLIHILTTIPTGGFSVYPDSIGNYNSPTVSFTVILFMLLGAISFPLYYVAFKESIKNFFQDKQLQTLLLLVFIGSVVFIVSFGLKLNSFVPGIFQTVTSITTTGFSTVPMDSLSDADKLVTTFVMIIGGSTGSTAGGIKLFRLLIMAGFVRIAVFKPVLPKDAEIPIGVGEITVTKEETELITAFFVTYLTILMLSTLAILWIENYGFTDTLFEVASAEGTVGLSLGITSSSLSVWSKIILILNMWIGRLEIIPVLVVLNPGIWMKKLQSLRN